MMFSIPQEIVELNSYHVEYKNRTKANKKAISKAWNTTSQLKNIRELEPKVYNHRIWAEVR
jgi:hypothetical protein